MNLLRAEAYPRTPWKNGGGTTLEVCRDQGSGLDGFGWRLSIADINEPGPFSSFSGYERVITVLEGEGMRLEVDGHSHGPLHCFEPFAFSGESQVNCELLGGPIRDFNLIYAPARYRAQLQWLAAEAPVQLAAAALTRVIFAAVAGAVVEQGGNSITLGQYDCVIVQGQAVSFSGHCALIELQAL